MVKDFIKYQFRNTFIYGIHCNILPDGKRIFRIVGVENKGGNLTFEVIGEVEDNANEIKALVKSNPVYLVVDGKGILLRDIVPEPDKSLIKQIIPTASEDEFIVDSVDGDKFTYTAIVRKELLDEISNQLEAIGLTVICLSVGPFKVSNLSKYFEDFPSGVPTGDYLIKYDKQNHNITSFEKIASKEHDSYKIDSKSIDSEYLLALSVGLEYFLESDQECEHPQINEQKKEFHSKIIFKKAGLSALVFVFIILMVNMLFYMHYNDKKQQMESQLVGNKNILNTLDTLKKELEWKEKFMKESGILTNTRMALYADRIAESVPEEIVLNKLEIHPVVGKIRDGKEIVLRPNVILLKGITKNSTFLNDWVHKLKTMSGVESVTILNYIQENDLNLGSFSIELGVRQTKI